MLKLTNECNLGNCKYCYTKAKREGESCSRGLSTRTYTGLIRHLVEDQEEGRLQELSLTGGEVFLRPDLQEITSFALSQGVSTRINTSGTLITPQKANALSGLAQEYGIPIIFQVGLDSADKRVHEFIRGNGTFDKTLDGISNLTNTKNPFTSISLRYTLMKKAFVEGDNVSFRDVNEDAKDYVKLASEMRVDRIKLRELLTSGYGINLKDFVLPASLIGQVQETFIEELREKDRLNLEISWPIYFRKEVPKNEKNRVKIPPCKCLDQYVSIDADGGVVGCVLLMGHPEQYIGNILSKDIIQIFNSSIACQMLNERYANGRAGGRCYAIDHVHQEKGINVELREKEANKK